MCDERLAATRGFDDLVDVLRAVTRAAGHEQQFGPATNHREDVREVVGDT